jgi:hypothetical protein
VASEISVAPPPPDETAPRVRDPQNLIDAGDCSLSLFYVPQTDDIGQFEKMVDNSAFPHHHY